MVYFVATNAVFALAVAFGPSAHSREFAQAVFVAAAPIAESAGKPKSPGKRKEEVERKPPHGHSSSHPSPAGSGGATLGAGFAGFWISFIGYMKPWVPFVLGIGTLLGLIGTVGGLMKGQVEAIFAIPAFIAVLFVLVGVIHLFLVGLGGLFAGLQSGDLGQLVAAIIALAVPAGLIWVIATSGK